MTLNVEIRVDAPQALPTIAAVETGLGKVETAGERATTALSKGFGNSSSAAEKAKGSTGSLAEQMAKLAGTSSAFSGFPEIFRRQADMLEKIHGPAREYASDLQALDMLLSQSSITTGEYAEQVTRMNAAIDGTKQKTEEASGPAEKLSGALGAFAMPAIGAGILGIGEKIAGLVDDMHRAADQYTVLENKALKFVDSSHSATQVLDEQQAMSLKLHTTMEPMINLFDKVKIGSDGMRLSHEQLLRMEQTLGEGVIVANKPIEEAAGLMERFAFAMESGVTQSRDIKRIMVEMPELAGVWRNSFHMLDGEILSAVSSGKLGARQLATAWTQSGAVVKKLDEDQLARTRTNDEATKEYLESLNKLYEHSDMTALNSAVVAGMKPEDQNNDFALRLKYGNDADAVKNGQQGQAAIDNMMKLGEEAIHLTGHFAAMGAASDKAWTQISNGIDTVDKKLGSLGTDVGAVLGALDHIASHGADPWDQTANAFGRAMNMVESHVSKIDEARKGVAALGLAMKSGGLAGDEARKQYEAFMTTLNDGRLPAAIKEWDAIHDPIRTYTEDLGALNTMLAKSEISWDLYDQQLQKVQSEDMNPLDQLINRLNKPMEDQARGLAVLGEAWGEYGTSAYHAAQYTFDGNKMVETSAGGWDRATLSITQYNDETERLQKLTGYEAPAKSVANALATPDFSTTPKPSDYGNGHGTSAMVANSSWMKGAKDLDKSAYAEWEKTATDAVSGVDKGFKTLRDDTLDIGKTISSSMKSVFDDINSDIVSMVTTGQADWGKLLTTIETDLAKIALQKLEAGVISYVGGAAATVAGSWAGSDTMIHAANGYSARVGGVGGTDTKLFAAMVSPGEHVSIQTPDQQKAQQDGGGKPNIQIVNQHDTRGELASGLSSGAFDTHVINIMKRNVAAVQSLLKK